MVRHIPELEHVCHVCDMVFVVTRDVDPETGRVTLVPDACPACGAPLRFVFPIDVGATKDLILTHYGAPYYRKQFGTAERLLAARSRTPADVERYLELAAAMDFEAWSTRARQAAARRGASAEDRKEVAIVVKARADAEAGRLLPALAADAAPVLEQRAAERARHLAIYEERRPQRGA